MEGWGHFFGAPVFSPLQMMGVIIILLVERAVCVTERGGMFGAKNTTFWTEVGTKRREQVRKWTWKKRDVDKIILALHTSVYRWWNWKNSSDAALTGGDVGNGRIRTKQKQIFRNVSVGRPICTDHTQLGECEEGVKSHF
jgi:hypothetical protein